MVRRKENQKLHAIIFGFINNVFIGLFVCPAVCCLATIGIQAAGHVIKWHVHYMVDMVGVLDSGQFSIVNKTK